MRRTILLLATMSFAVLVISGVAHALTIQCDDAVGTDQDPDLGFCEGTAQGDTITGNPYSDVINARGGDDTINALGGFDFVDAQAGGDTVNGGDDPDTIHGNSGEDTLNGDAANDTLFGDGRHDTLSGQGGVNEYFGGSGPDVINANATAGAGGNDEERSHGGPGNDEIFAIDGLVDLIDCGSGRDTIHIDFSSDALANDCETVLPN
jgi:Ca2+-binding RTX toxin-like protein